MNWSLLPLALSFIIALVHASCHDNPTFGPPNLFPILNGDTNLVFFNQTKNGKMYQVTVPNSGGSTSNSFYVVHVYGSAYEMGFAQGVLHGNRLKTFMENVWIYLESQVESSIPWVPKWLSELIANIGLAAALDVTEAITRDYTPSHFYEEMHGLSDAAGVHYQTLVRVHMLAGLTQGACSMFGIWGDALADKSKVLQLRALDWDMDGPFRDHSQITVYHPNEGHPFVNIGITGFVGGLSGISANQLGISEIGAGYPDSSFGSESRIGLPFIFLLRDILQFDYTLDDAINRMINARRTCDLMLGVGDGKSSSFRGMQYSYSVLDVMDDMNLRPNNATWHPKIKNVVYWGMDWDCPAYNFVLSTQIKKYYGQITPEIAISYLTAVEKSGDNHLAFYDLNDMVFFVSFAAPFNATGPVEAYARQFTRFNATLLLQESM